MVPEKSIPYSSTASANKYLCTEEQWLERRHHRCCRLCARLWIHVEKGRQKPRGRGCRRQREGTSRMWRPRDFVSRAVVCATRPRRPRESPSAASPLLGGHATPCAVGRSASLDAHSPGSVSRDTVQFAPPCACDGRLRRCLRCCLAENGCDVPAKLQTPSRSSAVVRSRFAAAELVR